MLLVDSVLVVIWDASFRARVLKLFDLRICYTFEDLEELLL